jgi:hypothetical protein
MTENALPNLLDQLGIERVLVVDDQFVPPPSVYTLAYEKSDAPALEGLPPLPEGADYEAHVEKHWSAVPLEERVKLREVVVKRAGLDPTGDPTGLEELVGDRYFRGMTLHEWEAEQATLLSKKDRALILFDVNFKEESGDADDEKGLEAARHALEAADDHFVGVLTTKAGVGMEEEAADEWAARADIARADLVVINKKLLADCGSEDLERLVEQIRGVLQASQIGELRHKVQACLQEALNEAAMSVSGSTPQVLEDLVFRSSREGGEWEVDTWFRLYATLGLKQARERLAGDTSARRAVEDVRNLLHSRQVSPHDDSAVLASRIEQAEAYADAGYLNGAGLPIANGDLFQAGKNGSVFVLVGQPCDLAVRPGGRARSPTSALLLPIKESAGMGAAERDSAYLLPAGGPFENGQWEVRFRPEVPVAFDVLDLVSFNSDGQASLKVADAKRLRPLLPGLQKRRDEIEKVADGMSGLLALVEAAEAADIMNKHEGARLRHKILGMGGPFKATLGARPTPFAFRCRRIGRLTGTYADALLIAHAAARSRTAHAHELTRIVADERN